MSRRQPAPPPRGTTGRADLLLALAVAPRDQLTLDVDASGWFGYLRRPDDAPQPLEVSTFAAAPSTPQPLGDRKLPLRLPFFAALAQRVSRPPPETEAEPQEDAVGPVLTEENKKALSDKRLVDFESLVPQARLLPALRRLLGSSSAGPLDTDRLIRHLASRQPPRHLPRRILPRWHPELVVLLDFCPRLWPYRWDMHGLAERLLQHVGRSGLSLRIIDHGPFGTWSDWLAHQNRQSYADPPERRWTMPRAGTPVLIVSDLGMLLGSQSRAAQAWADFIDALRRARVHPVALVPLGARQLGSPVASWLPLLRWSPDARPRPTHAHGHAERDPDGIEELLAMVAATRRVDPPLLRSMRRLNPRAPLNAGLEGALWCHADVEAGWTASVRVEAQDAHLHRFAEQLPALHARLDRLRLLHHAHLRAVVTHEETLLWAAHANDEAVNAVAERVEDAYDFMGRLARTLRDPDNDRSAIWRDVAEGIVQRADATMARRHAGALNPILRAVAGARKVWPDPPKWADPALLRDLMGADQPARRCWLVQDVPSGCLLLQDEPASLRQIPMGEPLALDAGGVRVSAAGAGAARWLSAAALPARLAPLGEPGVLHLETSREALVVAAVRRPNGAFGWGCDQNGIAIRTAPLGRWEMHWSGRALRATPAAEGDQTASWTLQADAVAHPDSRGAVLFGIDSRLGIFADLAITTRYGSATQRLRWIPPGSFLMGSPTTEAGRYDLEGPQHDVTIAQGFWLFDTPCTQAFWQAVTGDNPSYFKGPGRPVEQVSWDDVQDFLTHLNGLVPGLNLMLPTEAQWEYACRAGTDSASYAGDLEIVGDNNAPALDPIAWYGGNSGVDFDPGQGTDSSDWPEKQYPHTRAGTRPVAMKDPNGWGLYDMLGNVWEWCADGLRFYTAKPVTDPLGRAEAGAERVLRGGSWSSHARFVRSAYRYALELGIRNDGVGFRCAQVQGGREQGQEPDAEENDGDRSRSKPPETAS